MATFATLGDALKHAYSAANFIKEIAMETHTSDDELAYALVALAEMASNAQVPRKTMSRRLGSRAPFTYKPGDSDGAKTRNDTALALTGLAGWLPTFTETRPAENYPGEIVRAAPPPPKPEPPRTEYPRRSVIREWSRDGKTWMTVVEGARLDGARFVRWNGKIRIVRTADGICHESREHDFERWRLLAELEAEDNAPIRERFNPATFDPPGSELGPGIKARTFADPRPAPFIPSVCDMDLLPDV